MYARASSYSAPHSPRTEAATSPAPGRLPLLVLCGYYAIEYQRPQDFFPPLAAASPGLIISLISAGLWLRHGDKAVLEDRLIRLSILFALLIAVSVSWSVNTYYPAQTSKALAIYLFAATMPTAVLLASVPRMRQFFFVWLMIQAGVAFLAIGNGGRGPGAFLGDENDMALAANIAVPFAYYMSIGKGVSMVKRLLCWTAIALLLAAVVSTGSRGGFVTAVAALLGIVLISRHRVRNLFVVAVIAIAAATAMPGDYVAEMNTISDEQDSTRQDRIWSWRIGWTMYKDNPVLGVGANNYPWRVGFYEWQTPEFDPQTMKLHAGRAAHSLYVSLICDLGSVGALLYLAILWTLFRRLRQISVRLARTPQDEEARFLDAMARATLVALLAYLVGGVFLSVLYYPHLWYLIGFALALDRASRRYVDENPLPNPEAAR